MHGTDAWYSHLYTLHGTQSTREYECKVVGRRFLGDTRGWDRQEYSLPCGYFSLLQRKLNQQIFFLRLQGDTGCRTGGRERGREGLCLNMSFNKGPYRRVTITATTAVIARGRTEAPDTALVKLLNAKVLVLRRAMEVAAAVGVPVTAKQPPPTVL